MILIPHERSEVSTLDRWRHMDFIQHLHVLVCLYTKLLEGPWRQKIQLQFSIIWPSDVSQGPPQFNGHGPWPKYKLALSWVDRSISTRSRMRWWVYRNKPHAPPDRKSILPLSICHTLHQWCPWAPASQCLAPRTANNQMQSDAHFTYQ